MVLLWKRDGDINPVYRHLCLSLKQRCFQHAILTQLIFHPQISSTGPVKAALEDDMQVDEEDSSLLPKSVNIRANKQDKGTRSNEKTKTDPEMLIEGNTKLNKLRKQQFKKDKKKKAKNEKQAIQLADVLENVTITSFKKKDDYDFKEDFSLWVGITNRSVGKRNCSFFYGFPRIHHRFCYVIFLFGIL